MDINLIAVVLAALAAFTLGFIWYTILFSKPWQKEIGMTKEGEEPKQPESSTLMKSLFGSFIAELVMAFVLAYLLGTKADALEGLKLGILVALGFIATAFGVNYLFEGRSLRLWLLNSGYNFVVFATMGMIIGLL